MFWKKNKEPRPALMPEEEYTAFMEKIRYDIENEHYFNFYTKAKRALKKYPTDQRLIFRKGVAHSMIKEDDEAMELFSRVHEGGGDWFNIGGESLVRFQQAQILMRKEQYKEAREILSPAVQAGDYPPAVELLRILNDQINEPIEVPAQFAPESPEFDQEKFDYLIEKAHAWFADGNYAKAAEYFQFCTEMNPNDATTFGNLGNAYFYMGDAVKAFAAFNVARLKAPKGKEHYIGMCEALFLAGNLRGLDDVLVRAFEHFPDEPYFLGVKGIKLNWEDKYAEAEQVYRRALELDESYSKHWAGLSDTLFNQERYPEAKEALLTAFEQPPVSDAAYDILGLWKNRGMWEGPDPVPKSNIVLEGGGYKTYKDLSPEEYEHFAQHEKQAMAFLKEGNNTEAAGQFLAQLELTPGNPIVAANLGLAVVKMGDPARAFTFYKLAYTNDPSYIDALQGMCETCLLMNDLELLHSLVDEGLNKFPESYYYMGMIALLLNRSGRHEDSVEAHKEVLELEPDHSRLWAGLADSLFHLDRLAEAREAMEKALTHEPVFQIAYEVERFWKEAGKI